jgi:hypothetical protein
MWGDKNNYYLAHIDALRALYPGARFLHIVRDGRDVACSYREVMSRPSDNPYRPVLPVAIDDIARRWVRDVQSIRAQFATLDSGDTLETRYEDICFEPERELGRICTWLGITFSPKMLQFYKENREKQVEPPETIAWKLRTLEPITRDTIGRYVQMLDADELTQFLAIAAIELREYGYIT